MFDRTLFERLEATDAQSAATQKLDQGRLAASILANLNVVFNARQGSCATRPDFGLPDFNDALAKGNEGLPRIARSIREQIEKFEPRLSHVVVRPQPDPDDPLSMGFHITARIKGPDGARVSFQTTLAEDGSARVRH